MDKDLKIVIPFVIIFVLLFQIAQMHYEIRELRGELESLKNQQEQFSRIIREEYGRDIYAAIDHLRETRPDIMEKLGNASLTVDSISTWNFEASYDPREGVFWVWHDIHGWKERDVVYVRITAYYPNGTPVRGFPWIRYRVNHTTGEVIGVSSDTAQIAVMRAYNRLHRNVTAYLGISPYETRETCESLLGVMVENGTWFDFEIGCISTENVSLCWFVTGEVDEKTGILRRLEVTKPFTGECNEREELITQKIGEIMYSNNATAMEIRRELLNATGGLLFNLTFPNP